MSRVLGSVPYLNARPLISALPREFAVREAPPNELAARFRAGEFEAALLPIVEAFRIPGARVVPGVAIGAKGPVLSVRLFLTKPFEEIRSLWRDPHSLTSNALLEVLLANHWKRSIPGGAEAVRPDGWLLIGDPALRELGKTAHEVDLAEVWHAWTELPFVFAAWVTREPGPGLAATLAAAAEEGLAKRDTIAREWAPRLRLDEPLCRRYLRENIRFTLGDDDLRGAERFWAEAADLKLAPAAGRLPVL